jgi:hypothetical protein
LTLALLHRGLSLSFRDPGLLQTLGNVFVESRTPHFAAVVFAYMMSDEMELNAEEKQWFDMYFASAMWIWGFGKRSDENSWTTMDSFRDGEAFDFDMDGYYENLVSPLLAETDGDLRLAVNIPYTLAGARSGLIGHRETGKDYENTELAHPERYTALPSYEEFLRTPVWKLTPLFAGPRARAPQSETAQRTEPRQSDEDGTVRGSRTWPAEEVHILAQRPADEGHAYRRISRTSGRNLAKTLASLDQTLEALPEDKIEEFARSEAFESYKFVFEAMAIDENGIAPKFPEGDPLYLSPTLAAALRSTVSAMNRYLGCLEAESRRAFDDSRVGALWRDVQREVASWQ